jgi:SAM-dependent methyltransferase
MTAAAEPFDTAAYWEARAVRFGTVDDGLPAVCSYGMPWLYNLAIDFCQRRALAKYVRACRGLDVLDVGCGVGRWCLTLARDNRVVGVDLSPTMIELSRRRAAEAGVAVRFDVGDVVSLDLRERFDLVLVVTVLQHVLVDSDFDRAMQNLASHLRPGGRLVLLEVAPVRAGACASAVFRSRSIERYLEALRRADLEASEVVGVDIAPFRSLLLRSLPVLPRGVGRALLAAAAWLSLPIDLLLSRAAPRWSWHKVIVATRRAHL